MLIIVKTLGRYEILGELGRGGCGVVYRALDPGIGRTVAIKTILADANSPAGSALRERFRREARSAGNLSHPNIVTIHEFNDSGEIMFIAMELIQGHSLAEKMAEGGPLPLNLVLSVIGSSADALDYAHANGIVHRDVKPANFMLTAGGQVKVTDFGIAKMLDDEIGLTNTGMVIGTVQYMSPEQIAAKPASAKSDQFSLAVIAYEMLTGQKPFQGNSWASVMNQIMSVEPPPIKQHRQDLGDEVTTVLRKALAKDPEARYASCREFADDLGKAVTGVTMQRTAPMPIGEALTKPFAPPRTVALPETQVMVSSTAIPQPSDSSPDTGQKMTPTINPASTKTVTAEAPAKRRSALTPVLIGAAAAMVLAVGWWRFSARPVSTPAEPAPVVATTAPLEVSTAPSNPPPVETSSLPANPRKEVAPRTPVSKLPPPAVLLQAPSQPVPIAAAPPRSAPPVAVPAAPAAVTPAPPAVVAAPPIAVPTPQPVVASPSPVQASAPAPPPAPAPKPAPVQSSPAPAVVANVTPAPPPHNPDGDAAAARRAEEQRKAAELSAARREVDVALGQYRNAFESKDPEALKSIWPSLGRSELSAFQNFFRIARTIKLQLRPLGEAEITATGASVRTRRTMAATDERGAMPTQDQTVNIRLKRAGNSMVIESIDIAGK
ncbi:MAG: protein kinase [Acidobacteriota bacterium]